MLRRGTGLGAASPLGQAQSVHKIDSRHPWEQERGKADNPPEGIKELCRDQLIVLQMFTVDVDE